MQSNEPILFVFGPARGGTTFVGNLLFDWFGYGMGPEGKFIGEFYRRLGQYGDLDKQANLDRLLDDVHRCDMLEIMRSKWQPDVRCDVGRQMLSDNLASRDYPGVVRAVLRSVAQVQNSPHVGNKNPAFWTELDLLAELFPDDARFLCVIRDGRDVTLSLRKLPWGQKSAYMAGKSWAAMLDATAVLRDRLGQDRVSTIRYEDVLAKPEAAIAGLEQFTGVDLGADKRAQLIAKMRSNPLSGNYDKWRTDLEPEEIANFESVAQTQLAQHGYEVTNPGVTISWARRARFEAQEFIRKLRLSVASRIS